MAEVGLRQLSAGSWFHTSKYIWTCFKWCQMLIPFQKVSGFFGLFLWPGEKEVPC